MASARLSSAGIEAAHLEAQLLAAHVLLVDRTWLLAHADAPFNELAGEGLLQRRERREPLPYILGWREFYGRRFAVGPGVLIPRQETETTLELALSADGDHLNVLDIGTGSGALAITLKLERPGWTVTACDISQAALEICESNAKALGADVVFVVSDLASGFADHSFDLVVSNPPYIGREESLPPELSYEPAEALYAEESGLAIYRRLALELPRVLRREGWLVLEIGHTQQEVVTRLFEEGGWALKDKAKDLLGHTRALAFTQK